MRTFLLIIAFLLAPLGAAAQSVEDQITAQLQAQGYVEITMTRTLLGRLRVIAESPDHSRELVINPATGQILRDRVSQLRDTDNDRPSVVIPNSGAQNDRSSADPTPPPASDRRTTTPERQEQQGEDRTERREERDERRTPAPSNDDDDDDDAEDDDDSDSDDEDDDD